VFDGSDTSIGSNGQFLQHNGSIGTGNIFIPSGSGGGCIAEGPFSNLTANLGPVQPQQDGMIGVGVSNKLIYNPHCIQRDLSSWLATRIYTEDAFLDATIQESARDIAGFQSQIGQQSNGLPGVHGGGHQTLSGANSDLYSGVIDPAFYLHHAMTDRMYWMWQMTHYDQRKTISGRIALGDPNSRNATLEDPIELPFLRVDPSTIGELLDTLDGPLCYIYK
jgi:tyrosinase